MNMNALTTISTLSYNEMERLAIAIAKSNLFGMKTPEQAMSLMQIAQAEGRHPATAARDYDIIQGRAAKKSEAMHRDFLLAGGKVEWVTLSDNEASATFSHPQGGSATITWDMQRAAMAGLGAREGWKKYPRQMLRNRVVSEGVRTIWPVATSGMYEPGEVMDIAAPHKEPVHTGPTLEAVAESQPDVIDSNPASASYTAGNPEYPFATSKGGQIYRTGSEWLEAWRRLAENCMKADALDKLERAREMNLGAIEAVSEFDPSAAMEVHGMLVGVLGSPA